MTVIIAFVLRSIIVALAGLAAAQFLAQRGPAYVSLTYKATLVALLLATICSFTTIPANSHALHISAPAVAVRSAAEPTQTPAKHVSNATHLAATVSESAMPDCDTPEIVIVVWFVGICLLLLRVLASQFSLSQLRRQAKLLTDSTATLILARLSTKGGTPSLLVHPSIESPCLAGVLRPSIYISETLLKDAKLEPVLAHEMVHFQHNDCFWKLLQRITCAILWFNPFVWLACKRFDEAIEEHCDQVVISSGCERPVYARVLLELAQQGQTPSAAALSAGVVDFRSTVGKRVALVLDASRKTASVVSNRFRMAAIPAAAVLAIGVSVMISGEAIAQMTPEQMKIEHDVALHNAKYIDLALILYMNDYDDVLPYATDMDTLKAVTAPYVKTTGSTFQERRKSFDEIWSTHNPNHSEFLFNFALGGANQTIIRGAADTVLIYDSKPWFDGSRIVGFLDGHVKAQSKEAWADLKKYLVEKFPRQAKKPLRHQVLDESHLDPGPGFSGTSSAPPADSR
ncbi:MAG TPA: M56 family metallopeptidase [Fimbriimonadaceae bacterium]|jgi:beta-lactamase regulating signal transducer with metallopeptidase domain